MENSELKTHFFYLPLFTWTNNHFLCLNVCDGMVISSKSADKLFVTFYLPSPAPKSWSLLVPLCWFEEGIPGDSLSVLCLFRPICPGKFPFTLLWPMKPCRALFVPKSFVRSSSVFGRENKIEHSHDVWFTQITLCEWLNFNLKNNRP